MDAEKALGMAGIALAWLALSAFIIGGLWLWTHNISECKAHGFSTLYCWTSQ